MKKVIIAILISFFSFTSLFSQNLDTLFFDNFDSYTAGETLVSENPQEWMILGGGPGPMSAEVTDTFSFSGPNSVVFDIADNAIKPIDNFDTGIYCISFKLYIPDNRLAGFTTFQHFEEDNIYYGMQVLFNEGGEGLIYGGGFTAIPFVYSYGTWLSNKVIVDLDNDMAAYYLNNEMIHSWVWSSGMNGGGGSKQLGGSDFFAYYQGGNAIPEFFLDDYALVKLDSISFFDDFESYNSGEQLVCQNPENWITWNNISCSYEDPFIIDTLAYSGSNSVLIMDSNNLVYPIDNYITGKYKISFYMYVPIDGKGVFSILKLFDGDNSEIGVQINFNSDGLLDVEYGSTGQPIYYDQGFWMKNEIIINLDTDWAEYYFNEELLLEWQWSLGVVPGYSYQLAGVNFKADFWTVENAKYYIDDFQFIEMDSIPCFDPPQNVSYSIVNPNEVLLEWEAPNCPDLLGYNLYFEGSLLGFTTSNSYLNSLAPGTYDMCITAVYETGESECAWITIIITGTEEIQSRFVIISPNPSRNIVHVESERIVKEVIVFDMNGSIKMEMNGINRTDFDISVGKFNSGIYMILLRTKTESIYKKLIVR